MSFTKVTFLFNHNRYNPNRTTYPQTRASGWSETWYSAYGFDATQLYTTIATWLEKRLPLLGTGTSIVGWRVSETNPTGRTFTQRVNREAPAAQSADNPEQALVGVFSNSEGKNRRQVVLRGLPDSRVVYGEYANSPDFDRAIRAFMTHCASDWRFKGKGHAVPAVKIASISDTALVTTQTPHGLVGSRYVQIYRTVSPEKRQQGVQRIQATNTAPNQLQLFPMPKLVLPSTGGQVRVVEDEALFSIFLNTGFLDQMVVGKHDTGRPFFLQRGRRSAKRG